MLPRQTQVKRARLQALEYKRQYGSPMPSRLLALAMADAAQARRGVGRGVLPPSNPSPLRLFSFVIDTLVSYES